MDRAKYPATVVTVLDDETVVINRGAEHGVKEGQKFLIYFDGDEIFDPNTKKSLGILEIVRGKGIVSHVQQSMATIKSTETRKFNRRFVQRRPFLGFDQEEIVSDLEVIPFDEPQPGDKAKPI